MMSNIGFQIELPEKLAAAKRSLDRIEALAERGWLVSVRRFPPGTPIIGGDPRYETNPARIIKPWCLEAGYSRGQSYATNTPEFDLFMNHNPHSFADTLPEALGKLEEAIRKAEAAVQLR